MRKIYQKPTIFDSNKISKNNTKVDKLKTTNINILLNRVRNDEKKAFRKKAIFIILLISCLFVTGFVTLY